MAAEWVPVKAGTEGILALGIAHYLMREKNLTVSGKDSAKWSTIIINQYSLETVSKLTGVPVEKIKELGEGLAKAKNPIAVGGKGAGVPQPRWPRWHAVGIGSERMPTGCSAARHRAILLFPSR